MMKQCFRLLIDTGPSAVHFLQLCLRHALSVYGDFFRSRWDKDIFPGIVRGSTLFPAGFFLPLLVPPFPSSTSWILYDKHDSPFALFAISFWNHRNFLTSHLPSLLSRFRNASPIAHPAAPLIRRSLSPSFLNPEGHRGRFPGHGATLSGLDDRPSPLRSQIARFFFPFSLDFGLGFWFATL